MKFINFKQYAKSWSTWVLGLVTVVPVLNDTTGIVSGLIPEQYQGVAVSILGAIGLFVRAIKQFDKH